MTRLTRGEFVAISLLTIALTGCTTAAPVGGPAVPNEVVTFGDFGRGAVDMPDGEVVASLEDLAVIHRGVQVLTEGCMHDRGFDYVALKLGEDQQWEPLAVGPPDPDVLRRYGYTVLAASVRDGQRLDTTGSPDARRDPNAQIVGRMRGAAAQRWTAALFGETGGPTVTLWPQEMSMRLDGCYAQGLTAVLGSAGALLNIEQGGMAVMSRAYELLHTDAAFIAAYDDWRACMGEKGRAVAPLDAGVLDGARMYGAALVSEAYTSMHEQARSEERLIAEADADCQQSTDLDRVTKDTRERILQKVAADMSYDLRGRQELIARAVERARLVTAEQGEVQ
jgi:hypothetical protein